jgi:hypothetical protein
MQKKLMLSIIFLINCTHITQLNSMYYGGLTLTSLPEENECQSDNDEKTKQPTDSQSSKQKSEASSGPQFIHANIPLLSPTPHRPITDNDFDNWQKYWTLRIQGYQAASWKS